MAAGWNKGKKWSDEVRQRISEGMLKNHPMRGKHWSLEIRQRQSKAHREALELRRKQMLLLLLFLDLQKQQQEQEESKPQPKMSGNQTEKLNAMNL